MNLRFEDLHFSHLAASKSTRSLTSQSKPIRILDFYTPFLPFAPQIWFMRTTTPIEIRKLTNQSFCTYPSHCYCQWFPSLCLNIAQRFALDQFMEIVNRELQISNSTCKICIKEREEKNAHIQKLSDDKNFKIKLPELYKRDQITNKNKTKPILKSYVVCSDKKKQIIKISALLVADFLYAHCTCLSLSVFECVLLWFVCCSAKGFFTAEVKQSKLMTMLIKQKSKKQQQIRWISFSWERTSARAVQSTNCAVPNGCLNGNFQHQSIINIWRILWYCQVHWNAFASMRSVQMKINDWAHPQ